MAEWIGIGRRARKCYGFDDVAIVPGMETVDTSEVNTTIDLCGHKIKVPIIAAAMDGVVDVTMAIEMSKRGGLAVLNLEGVQTRYDDPQSVLKEIISSTPEKATKLVQSIYTRPIKEKLISKRVEEIKNGKGIAAVSSTPQNALKFGQIAAEAGADIFVVQSTVTSTRHFSSSYKSLDIKKFCKKEMKIPVIVGNCVTYDVTLELMFAGAAAVLVGIGPGAACTTRGVLGIGVPQITSTVDAAAARDLHFKRTGRYCPIITDGGMDRGGDICKAFAAGADAVMVGSAFAKAKESPGQGYHWGMATSHANLPRGTRINVGIQGSIENILFGPAKVDDGSQNLLGALVTSMGCCGAKTISDFQLVELILAPNFQSEGKVFQATQQVGMGKRK